MNIITICKRLLNPQLLSRNCRYFSKSSSESNKPQQQKNQNYLRSKIPINKASSKQAKLKQITHLSFNDGQDLRYFIMSNVLLMGAIPFWAPLNIGICLINGGYILNRIGQQTKRFLLLVNNNQLEGLSNFRQLDDYLKLIFANMTLLSFQSLMFVMNTYEVSLMFNMLWVAISIKQKVLPVHFYLVFIPLFLSIFINTFSESIRAFLLEQKPTQKKKDSVASEQVTKQN